MASLEKWHWEENQHESPTASSRQIFINPAHTRERPKPHGREKLDHHQYHHHDFAGADGGDSAVGVVVVGSGCGVNKTELVAARCFLLAVLFFAALGREPIQHHHNHAIKKGSLASNGIIPRRVLALGEHGGTACHTTMVYCARLQT